MSTRRKIVAAAIVVLAAVVACGGIWLFRHYEQKAPNQAGFPEIASPADLVQRVPAATSKSDFCSIQLPVDAATLVRELELDWDTAESIAALPVSEQRNAIYHALDEGQGAYLTSEAEDGSIEITQPFALKRLVINANQAGKIEDLGANAAVYDPDTDLYILTYDTMTETADAYQTYVDEIGAENILIDSKVYATELDDYDGWGLNSTATNLGAAENVLQEESARLGTVTVAVIDSGIRSDHVAFEGLIDERSKAFLTNDTTPSQELPQGSANYEDDNGHGTHVAGIIASATPSNVKLLVIKTLDENGAGNTLDLIYGARYASQCGADICNMSLGGSLRYSSHKGTPNSPRGAANSDEYIDGQIAAMDTLLAGVAGNMTVFAASANAGEDFEYDKGGTNGLAIYPAISPFTHAIGATNSDGTRAYYSNYGPDLEFAFPGTSINGCGIDSSTATATKSGTSMATPYASAFMADLMLIYPDKNEYDLINKMKTLSTNSNGNEWDAYLGFGQPQFSEEMVADIGRRDLNKRGAIILDSNVYFQHGTEAVTPTPAVYAIYNDEWHRLSPETDYDISYSDNTSPGEATITAIGKGEYHDSVSTTFLIKALPGGDRGWGGWVRDDLTGGGGSAGGGA